MNLKEKLNTGMKYCKLYISLNKYIVVVVVAVVNHIS